MAEIISFKGQEPPKGDDEEKHEPVPRVVEALEVALEYAKAGHIKGVCIVAEHVSDQVYCGSYIRTNAKVIGNIAMLLQEFIAKANG